LALADAHQIGWPDIDLFAVAAGPGSFTGLRIGIATIQGLALTLGRNVAAVSALEALAQSVSPAAAEGALIAAWMDAHRGEVFAALYEVTGAGPFDARRLIELHGPAVGDPGSMIDGVVRRSAGRSVLFAGDGAVRHAAAIEGLCPRIAGVLPPPLLAAAIGRMALGRARRGETVHPSAVGPLYLRRPDAELDRERKRGAQGAS
jgi:tRNA threonylcarbamoyladenosine biosynthesis protein TsaB